MLVLTNQNARYICNSGKAVDLRTLRVPGVLQRLALTYLVLGIMEAALAKSHDPHQVNIHPVN